MLRKHQGWGVELATSKLGLFLAILGLFSSLKFRHKRMSWNWIGFVVIENIRLRETTSGKISQSVSVSVPVIALNVSCHQFILACQTPLSVPFPTVSFSVSFFSLSITCNLCLWIPFSVSFFLFLSRTFSFPISEYLNSVSVSLYFCLCMHQNVPLSLSLSASESLSLSTYHFVFHSPVQKMLFQHFLVIRRIFQFPSDFIERNSFDYFLYFFFRLQK